MGDIFSTIQKVVDIGKKLHEIAEKTKDADTRILIADQRLLIADLKTQCAELHEKNAELTTQADVSKKLRFKGNHYMLLKDDGTEEGPYCSRCWDSKRNLTRMHKWRDSWGCPVCVTLISIGGAAIPGNVVSEFMREYAGKPR